MSVQPPRKTHKGLWITLGVVALLIVVGNATEDSPAEKAAVQAESDARVDDALGSDPIDASEFEIPAELVVDAMGSDTISEFCVAYFNVGDYDLSLDAFSQGYVELDPSAEEVFDELLTRC